MFSGRTRDTFSYARTFFGTRALNSFTLSVFALSLFFGILTFSNAAKSGSMECARFYGHLDLGIQWTPYSKSAKVPEVLNDQYVIQSLISENFRLFLQDKINRGENVVTDFKQIADATPKYGKGNSPTRPKSLDGKRILQPWELTPDQLLNYILDNYKLADQSQTQRALLSADKIVLSPPLIEKWQAHGPEQTRLVRGALLNLHDKWLELLQESPKDDRSSLLHVPNPYVVAGGRFRESYYWDTLWIMKGLIESGYHHLAKGMLENLVYLFETHGIIPNGNRFYYLTRTQLPVFMEMVKLLETNQVLKFNPETIHASDASLEKRILSVGKKYYQTIWKGTDRYKPEFGLFSYSDGAGGAANSNKIVIRPERGIAEPVHDEKHSQRTFAESGWDMTYSRFGRYPQNWLPVDLNFMLAGYCRDLAHFSKLAGKENDETYFSAESETIYSNLNRHLFDHKKGLYFDLNWATKQISKVTTAASFFPFYFEAYKKNDEAKTRLLQLLNKLKRQGDLAIRTTDREGKGQWDGAWTWAPLNEIAFQALMKYGLKKEADQLAFDFSVMVITTFYRHEHRFFEKHRVDTNSIEIPKDSEIYGNEEGFGWTNGVLSQFLSHLTQSGRIVELESSIRKALYPDQQ